MSSNFSEQTIQDAASYVACHPSYQLYHHLTMQGGVVDDRLKPVRLKLELATSRSFTVPGEGLYTRIFSLFKATICSFTLKN